MSWMFNDVELQKEIHELGINETIKHLFATQNKIVYLSTNLLAD